MMEQTLADYPQLRRLTEAVLSDWPEHRRYIDLTLSSRDESLMRFSDLLSGMIIQLSSGHDGGLEQAARDYRYLCDEIILPEEWHFRRTGAYRLSTFAEAVAAVYSREAFMTRYMNGLLVSDVFWVNHSRALQHYSERYLPELAPETRLLEIGPGHGLLLGLASRVPSVVSLTGWDVSAASLESTRHALAQLGVQRPVSLVVQDIFAPGQDLADNAFDAIVLSEVLEHLEEPDRAMQALFHLCRPGGTVWINVPANSPAPDHLVLLKHPDEAAGFVSRAGFEVIDTASFAGVGVTMQRALKQALTISCVVVGRKPA